MDQIRECILRLKQGVPIREIERQLSMHRTIIRRVKAIAIKKEWLVSTLMPDMSEIAKEWQQATNKKCSISPLDQFAEEIKTWRDEGYSHRAIYNLLKEKLSCSIYKLGRYIRKKFPPQVKPVMIRTSLPGECMEVDFGYVGVFWDSKLRAMKKTWVFSARLRYSRRAYRQVVTNQNVTTFISCHINAFEFFQGLPDKIVLDNLKAGVIESCIDNSKLNRSYREMAEYYKVSLAPCRPRTPEHKGGVENDMRYIKGNFLPIILERLKHQPKLDLIQLQAELDKWGQETADKRIVYGVGKTPCELFEEEKQALKSLPGSRWDVPEWRQCIVRRDWRIMYANNYYSVPYTLIGETVEVCATSNTVRIFHNYNEVALHSRSYKKWEYQRSSSHAPPFQEAVLKCSREELLQRAQEVGNNCYAFAEKILNDPTVDRLTSIRWTLKLAIKYSKERLEKACERALYYNTLLYGSVKMILEKDLDKQFVIQEKSPDTAKPSIHARDPKEYKSQIHNENQGG